MVDKRVAMAMVGMAIGGHTMMVPMGGQVVAEAGPT